MSKVMEEWLNEERIEMALAMLKDGMVLENVAKYSKFPLSKVKELAAQVA